MDTEEGWRVSGHLPMMTWEEKTEHKGTFMEYLRSQEEHISQYYTQIEFHVVPMKIYELFKSTKKALIATDTILKRIHLKRAPILYNKENNQY